MTKSTITREQAEEAIDGLEGLISRGVQSVYLDIAIAGLRQLVPAMDQKPALHRYRRKAVEPYGPYPWHYEVFVDYPQPFEDIEDEYFYAAPPVVTGFAVDGESECLPLDYLQGHKDGLEWAAQLAEANHPETGDWLYDDPIELAKAIRKGPDMPPAQPAADSEPDRNPVLAYADSYRDMAKQGVESVPIWSVITDLERNIAPLYRHAQPAPASEPVYQYWCYTTVENSEGDPEEFWFWKDCEKDFYDRWKNAKRTLYKTPQPALVVPEDIPDCVYEILCQACGGNAWMYSDALWNACRAAMLQELKKSAGTEATCRSNENVQAVEVQSLTSINPAPDLVSLRKKAESIIGSSPAIPDGYVMVPKEPTKQMILAGQEELESCIDNGFDSDIDGNSYDYTDIVPDAPHRVFMAMLEAAPQEIKS